MSNISFQEYTFSSILQQKLEQKLKHEKSLVHANITIKNDNHDSTRTPSFFTYSDSNASCCKSPFSSPLLPLHTFFFLLSSLSPLSYLLFLSFLKNWVMLIVIANSSLSGCDDELELAKSRLDDIIGLYQNMAHVTSKYNTTNAPTLLSEQAWHRQFLQLMSDLTHHAEQLENFSTDMLNTETQVRQLLSLEKSIVERLHEQEKLYISRLEECHQVLGRQIELMNCLDEISHSLQDTRNSFDSSSSTTLCSTKHRHSLVSNSTRVNVQDTSLDTWIHRIRCELSLRIGGSASTGCVMHSFQHGSTTEWIVSGLGTATNFEPCKYTFHIRLGEHHPFRLLPKEEWISDDQVDQCQSEDCSTYFTLLQRRHHCRKCGHIVCQRHSMNRASLLNASDRLGWHRVCNHCFDELMEHNTIKQSTDSLMDHCK
ncbi:hypothetical protein BD560DRAFT_110441 [Blakeslea trispora]|nr:hypothetical protein BD560DRAFT_110441 [Blakeslea trispora]